MGQERIGASSSRDRTAKDKTLEPTRTPHATKPTSPQLPRVLRKAAARSPTLGRFLVHLGGVVRRRSPAGSSVACRKRNHPRLPPMAASPVVRRNSNDTTRTRRVTSRKNTRLSASGPSGDRLSRSSGWRSVEKIANRTVQRPLMTTTSSTNGEKMATKMHSSPLRWRTSS